MSSQTAPSLVDRIRFKREQLKDWLPPFPGTPYVFLSPYFVLFGVFLVFLALQRHYVKEILAGAVKE